MTRSPQRIEITGGPAGHTVRIKIDGNDVSSMCQALTFKASAGGIVRLTLQLTGDATITATGAVGTRRARK